MKVELGKSALISAATAAVLLFGGTIGANLASAEEIDEKFDSYGGNREIQGAVTGFFHLEEIEVRHFLITPEGHGYRALGINHFHMMTSKDYDGAIRKIREWGFNAGCYQGPRWMWDRYPYTKGINLVPTSPYRPDSYFGFRDVFDPKFLADLDEMIRNIVEPQRRNPFLIGYLIGYNKCQYQDQLLPDGMLKQGLLRRDERPYAVVEGIAKANRKALELAYLLQRAQKGTTK